MAKTPPTPPREVRQRDAERSKRALLEAGTELFSEKGYSRARLRDIADRAGLDAALVIRYFGSKEGLYKATLERVDMTSAPLAIRPTSHTVGALIEEIVDSAMTRWDTAGIGPLGLSLSRPDVSEETRDEVRTRLAAVLEPLTEAAQAQGASRPALRAELAIAALVGIGTMRTLRSLEGLGDADRQDVERLLRLAMSSILTG